MSDAPSKSNAEIDKPRRGIGRFLWYNAIATTLGCIVIALTFDHIYLLYPACFGVLLLGLAVICREMLALLSQDSQYCVEESVAEEVVERTTKPAAKVRAHSTPHAA